MDNSQTDPWLSSLPFNTIHGENVEYNGPCIEGILVLTNYRLLMKVKDSFVNIPLGLIEQVEHRDIFYLHVICKDARLFRCDFDTHDTCAEWFRRLQKATSPVKSVSELFAFRFSIDYTQEGKEDVNKAGKVSIPELDFPEKRFNHELRRMSFDLEGAWRISHFNRDFKVCSSYPQTVVVPACIPDEKLLKVAAFRGSHRIPAVVWRHRGNGAVIARCSQPEVGLFCWRSTEDEDLVKAIGYACATDCGGDNLIQSANYVDSTTEEIQQQSVKKLLIVDARSYATAVANRARGGGCEFVEYYHACEIQFMCLANIHSVRKSFQALRQLCASTDQTNWFSQLESTKWLYNLSGLLRSAVTIATAVETEGRPVLVHCSDGWDRTPQLVALAELLLDPYYRTMNGFQVLVEREWLDFGHKFADRCTQGGGGDGGNEDPNERCPIFLQFLDCIHQLLSQFPCAFEFNQVYLVKLAQHVYSNLFGSFLCNSVHERIKYRVYDKTQSVWKFFRVAQTQEQLRNYIYTNKTTVIWPSYNISQLKLWSAVYVGESPIGNPLLEDQPSCSASSSTSASQVGEDTHHNLIPMVSCLPKTRSCEDLCSIGESHEQIPRRCSDPNILDSLEIHQSFSRASLQSLNSTKEIHSTNGDSNDPTTDSDKNSVKDNEVTDKNTQTVDTITYTENANIDTKLNVALKSIESSTDTLVSETGVVNETLKTETEVKTESLKTSYPIQLLPLTTNNLPPPSLPTVQKCTVCLCSRKLLSTPSDFYGNANPTPARTPGNNGFLPTPMTEDKNNEVFAWKFDIDGLISPQDEVQMRVLQIAMEYKAHVEYLTRELQETRMALRQQLRHQCSQPDFVETNGWISELNNGGPLSVGHESLASSESSSSWETVDEKDTQPALWVPDFSATHCRLCGSQFWLGKRRHHCRKCGKVFCDDCSNNFAPIPSEQLFQPVRVCDTCYKSIKPTIDNKCIVINENTTNRNITLIHTNRRDNNNLRNNCKQECITSEVDKINNSTVDVK